MNTLNIWMMIVGLELLLVIVVIIIGVLLILRNKNASDAPREVASDVKKVNSNHSFKKTEKKNKSSYTGPQYMNIAPVKPEYSDATTILSNAALNPVEDGATTVLGAAELSNNISLGTLTSSSYHLTILIPVFLLSKCPASGNKWDKTHAMFYPQKNVWLTTSSSLCSTVSRGRISRAIRTPRSFGE